MYMTLNKSRIGLIIAVLIIVLLFNYARTQNKLDIYDVLIIDDSYGCVLRINNFPSKILDNERDIYIYLPPSYNRERNNRFPILYVQDGKGVFETSDWSKESMVLHHTLNQMIEEQLIDEIIVVAISNTGPDRSKEYAYWDGIDQGQMIESRGKMYEQFLLTELKPYIDSNYRTSGQREETAIMGASLGGSISLNIALNNPDVFGKIIIQSPYIGWGQGEFFERLDRGDYVLDNDLKYYLDISEKEKYFLNDYKMFEQALIENGFVKGDTYQSHIYPEGNHSEKTWGQRIDKALLFQFSK